MHTSIDVLVVDHSDSDADITLLAIRRAIPEVTAVHLEDGNQALQFIFCSGNYSERPPENPRLILLELDLPTINGLQVLDVVRRDRSTMDIPVVLLTSALNPSAVDCAYALGANDYVIKPVRFEKYCAEVSRILERWLPDTEPPPGAEIDCRWSAARR